MTAALSHEEAAQIIGVHPNTVRSWLSRGIVKSLNAADVEAFRARIMGEESPAATRYRVVPAFPGWWNVVQLPDRRVLGCFPTRARARAYMRSLSDA